MSGEGTKTEVTVLSGETPRWRVRTKLGTKYLGKPSGCPMSRKEGILVDTLVYLLYIVFLIY